MENKIQLDFALKINVHGVFLFFYHSKFHSSELRLTLEIQQNQMRFSFLIPLA